MEASHTNHAAQEIRKSLTFLEVVGGTLIFLGAVLTSFIWIPVAAIVSGFAALAGGLTWLFRRTWSSYDDCYPMEIDRDGRAHPYMRVMTGIGRPSSGFMGGREADPIVPHPSSRRLADGKASPPPPPFLEDLAVDGEDELVIWDEADETRERRYDYGA